MAFPGLTETFLNSYQLEGFYYDFLWRGNKGTPYGKISSAYHPWPELWYYIYCFAQSGEAFTLKGNKHTHKHTHTHTHTHTYASSNLCFWHNFLKIGAFFKKYLLSKTIASIFFKKKLCFCFMKVFKCLLVTSNDTKTCNLKYHKK